MTLPVSAPPRFLPLFLIALAVRIGIVVLGVWLSSQPPGVLKPDGLAEVEIHQRITTSSASVIEPMFRWDGMWYARIALHGYSGTTSNGGQLSVAFMPMTPATMAVGELLGLNPFWFVLIVVNLVGAAGAALFARLTASLLGDRAAGVRAFVLLLAFPTAFFWSAPYNESFGLLFTVAALWAWLANRPLLAGAAGFLGSLARLTGVALSVAAVGDWLLKRDRHEFRRALAVAIGSAAGLVAFWGFLWWAVGDPFAGLKIQAAWGRRELSIWNPFYTIKSIYDQKLFRPDYATHFGWEAVTVVGFTLLGLRAWRKRGAFWGLVVLVPIAQMFASGTLLSANRIILAAVPAFIELADLLRRRTWFLAVVVCFALAQFVLLNRYVHWQFAG